MKKTEITRCKLSKLGSYHMLPSMCGRAYETYTEEELNLRYINEKTKRNPLHLKPNYNLSPTQLSPIILVKDGKRTIELLRWGLVPAWAKDIKSAAKYSLINARSEEITEKRSYKYAFEKRRCIVPLTGFFEWKRTEKNKRPFAIHLKDSPIMSVAGVWEHWKSKEDDTEVNSFSVLTVSANHFMEKIHDRMPVILDQINEEAWLDPENTNMTELKKLLKPCKDEIMKSYEVSVLVNSPKNNRAEVLNAVG